MQTARSASRTCSASRVGGRVDGDRLDAELVQRADHAHGDLAAVRDEHAREHQTASSGCAPTGSSSNRSWPNSTGSRVLDVDRADDPVRVRLDLVHQLHRLEDAERLARARRRRPPRRTAARPAAARGRRCRPSAPRRARSRPRGRRDRRLGCAPSSAAATGASAARSGSARAAHGDAHARLLDRHLADARLLDDADDLADPLRARLVDAARDEAVVAAARGRGSCAAAARPPRRRARAAAAPPRSRRAPPPPRAASSSVDRCLRPAGAPPESSSTARCDGRVDRARRRAEAALDRARAARRRRSGSGSPRARGAAPASRGSGRSARRAAASRPRSRIRASSSSTSSRRSPAACARRCASSAADEARRQVVLGGAHGDPRRERRHRLVADVLVDELRRLPERVDVDAGVEPEPGERRRERLAGDAVERERDRVDGAGDRGRRRRAPPRARRRARCRPRPGSRGRPAGRSPRASAPTSSLRALRLQRAGRVVEEHARGAELGQLARLLDERLRLARVAGAVDEAGVELAAGGGDRLAGLAQVRDVVQRVVQAEDVDPALGRGGDEAAHEVAADRPRADEEAAAQRHRERRLRARLERADPLPRALDAAAHGACRRRRRRRPRGTRSRRRRGSRRAAAAPPSASARRAAPGRAGGSSCRRARARAETLRARLRQAREM